MTNLLLTECTILSYNIMRDDIHEKTTCPHLNWVMREEMILDIILTMNCDIICLIECRDLKGAPFRLFAEKLNARGNYACSFHHDVRNPKLRVATFWKIDKFRNVQSKTFWLKNDERSKFSFPRPVGFDCLFDCSTGKSISVYNTHFAHEHNDKISNINSILHIICDNSGFDNPSVLCLDANFFGPSSLQLRQMLCSMYNLYELKDFTYYSPLWSESMNSILYNNNSMQRNVHSTFVGSSVDLHKTSHESLDLICGHNIYCLYSFIVDMLPPTTITVERREEMKRRLHINIHEDKYPSDHFPLMVKISF